MDAVFEDMKQDTTTFIGLMEHMKEGKDELFFYFPQRDPRKATCKPHVPCIFDPMRARFICGKCWRIIDGLDAIVQDTTRRKRRYEQGTRRSRR